MRDLIEAYGVALVSAVLGTIIILIVGLLFAVSQGTFNQIEREANQQSPEFIEGRISAMRIDLRGWHTAENQINSLDKSSDRIRGLRAQQQVLIDSMHEEAQKIPASEVPTDIAEFLEAHPYGAPVGGK